MFGAPLAHEDHPQRALYAALRMLEELRRYAATLRERGRAPIEIRVGVNTGEVVVRAIQTAEGHAEYTPIGHATNLASRMQTVAATGTIAATEDTRKLCEGYFTFRSLGPTRVKGVSEAVNVHEVTGLGPLRTRLQASARRGLSKFVGREAELAQMKRALDLSEERARAIVAAVGEAGLGKSRLFYEFQAIGQPGCLVLETLSVSHGKASAYLPLIDLLKNYFDITAGRRCPQAPRKDWRQGSDPRSGAGRHAALLLHTARGGGGRRSLARMGPEMRRRRTLDAIKRLLLRESLNQPLIVIFEDLHWLDEGSQALLNLLVESIGTARVLMLVNYRPEFTHNWGNKTYYTQLRLDPLGAESGEEMLGALLGDGRELAPLKRMIVEKTEGNPFFMEEIVQALFEQRHSGSQRRRQARQISQHDSDSIHGAGGAGLAYRPAAAEQKGPAADARGDWQGVSAQAGERSLGKSDDELAAAARGPADGRVHLRATRLLRCRVCLQACAIAASRLRLGVAGTAQSSARTSCARARSAIPRNRGDSAGADRASLHGSRAGRAGDSLLAAGGRASPSALGKPGSHQPP